jgi:hypothetical protein
MARKMGGDSAKTVKAASAFPITVGDVVFAVTQNAIKLS